MDPSKSMTGEPAEALQAPNLKGSIGTEFAVSWRAMVVVVLGMWASSLPAYSIGAFIGPLSEEFGWSVTKITGWSLAWSVGCIISAPIVGTLADRHGARRVILTALFFLAAALLAVSWFTDRLWLFYSGGFALGVIGAATSAITYGRVVSSLFDRGLGTALGLMSTGIGLGAVTGPRAMQAIIDAYGWRWAFAVEAILPLAILPLLFLWLKEGQGRAATDSSRSDAEGISRARAMRMPVFWILSLGSILYGVCVGGVSVNLIPYLTSEGLTRSDAAAAAGLFGAATVIGRLGGGMIIDRVRIHAARLMALILVGEGLAFIVLGAYGTTFLLLSIPVFGLAVGAEADCLAYCTVRIFGRRCFSSIFGVLGIMMLYLGTGVGPILFSATQDYFSSYQTAFFAWSGIAFIAAPLFASVARVPFFHEVNPPGSGESVLGPTPQAS